MSTSLLSTLAASLVDVSRHSESVAIKLIEAKAVRVCPPSGRSAYVGRLQIDVAQLSRIVAELWHRDSDAMPLGNKLFASLLGSPQTRVRWDGQLRAMLDGMEQLTVANLCTSLQLVFRLAIQHASSQEQFREQRSEWNACQHDDHLLHTPFRQLIHFIGSLLIMLIINHATCWWHATHAGGMWMALAHNASA